MNERGNKHEVHDPCAGYATRLCPLTENFPKPLLKVQDKTILDWLIDDIDSSGTVDEYVVIPNHKFAHHFDVYGSVTNRVTLQKKEGNNRLRYMWSRVFAPYEKLATYYPILKKHRWLMPVMQVRRWFMLLRPDVLKMAKGELAVSRDMEAGTKDGQSELLELLEIAPSSW